jgi:hypothetical protein
MKMRIRLKIGLFVLVHARAFAPFTPITSPPASLPKQSLKDSSSPTELYGIRSYLRRKFFPTFSNNSDGTLEKMQKPLLLEDIDGIGTSYQRKSNSLLAAVSTSIPAMDLDGVNGTLSSHVMKAEGTTIYEFQQLDDAPPMLATIANIVAVAQEEEEDLLLDAEHTLPPRDDAQLTTFEREFRNMLLEFAKFTRRDIAHVRSPRLRALFEGIAASYYIPETYRAFEVLFEDYAPLRIGGRLIYAQLKQAMLEAQLERKQEVESISKVTGLSIEEIDASRVAWLKMAVHKDDKAAQLSIQQLVDYGLAETVAEVLGHDDFERWLDSLNQNFSTDEVTFCELMLALQNCSVDSTKPECNPNTLLPEIARRLEPRQKQLDARSLNDKKKRLVTKYDSMVSSFLEWKDNVSPDKQSRKMDVLRGCFAGAESEEIVNALRIVYMDYSALRIAGDLIFKVMKTLVGSPARILKQKPNGTTNP